MLAVDVLTWHGDNARDGLNDHEIILKPANVNQATFGKIFSLPVDGQLYAQPLYVSNLAMPAIGVHNVVFAATEHDSVYAFDADTPGGALWHVSLIPPGATTVPQLDTGVSDIVPEVGITGTPVIDAQTKTLYVVSRTKETGTYVQRLHALDLLTGAEKFGGPVVISAPSFFPLKQNQRPGLALVDGAVYIAWASHGDVDPYRGFVIAYDAQSLQQLAVWNATADGEKGGIWMSGAAPAIDDDGNLYLMTGNGTFNANTGGTSYGQSAVKLKLHRLPGGGHSLDVVDYFTPFNYAQLEMGDVDLGSGGLMLLPDQPGAHPHELIGGGKQGRIYLMDRDNMGHWTANSDNIVQTLDSQVSPIYSTPAYFNGSIYYQGTADNLKRFQLSNGQLSSTWSDLGPTRLEFPGPSPVISANGAADGIVWIYQFGGTAVLHAYNVSNGLTELYNSSQAGPRDQFGAGVKFAVPTVANGKVYVGGSNALTVFGNINIPPTIPNPPSNLSAQAVDPTHVTLSWQDNSGNEIGFVVERSTDGVNFSTIGAANANVTVFTDVSAAGSTAYSYRVRAISNAGQSAPSNIAAATTPAPPYVGYWQFDEGSGATTADASGNGITGTLFGEVTRIAGYVGSGALNFHGAGVQDAHVQTNDNPAIDFSASQDFTLSAWIDSGGFRDKWAGLVTKSADRPAGYGLYLTPDNHWAAAASSSDPNALVSPDPATLGWHHLALVQHGGSVRELYVDGQLAVSGSLAGPGASAAANGAGPLYIGGSAGTIQEFFGGAIDDVRIYARALSNSELEALVDGFNPAAPDNLTAQPLSSTQIALAWEDHSSNEAGFDIQRSTDNLQFNSIATTAPDVTQFVDNTLSGSTRYYYRIRAINQGGGSDYSKVVTTITQVSAAVGSWQFVEGAGSTTSDLSGHGNIGALTGGVTWSQAGRVAFGLALDGSGYVSVADSPSLNPTSGLSIAVWVNASQWNGGSRIFAKGNSDNQYELFNSSGALNVRIYGVGQLAVPIPSAGVWHHIAATYDNATLKLYIDGVLTGSTPAYGTMLTTTDPLYIGTKNGPAHNAFDSFVGTIDEVDLFDRAITPAEVNALAHPATEPSDPSNLVATAVSPTQINITWNDNSTDEQSWLIERSPDNVDWVPLALPLGGDGNMASYSDQTVARGQRYYYRVRAHNSAGDSEYSNVATTVTPIDVIPPTVATPAAAQPNIVQAKTAVLSVLGADDRGEANLTYTWAAIALPAGAPGVSFTTNGNNLAKNTTVTFGRAGTYVLQVTIKDKGDLTVTSQTTVTVLPTATSIKVTPAAVALPTQTLRQFLATLVDQFSDALATQPAFSWSVRSGGTGTITPAGLYSSPVSGGTDILDVTGGNLTGSTTVTINAGPQYPASFTSTNLTFAGAGKIVNGRLRLMEQGTFQAGSAFYSTKISAGGFTTDFNLQLTSAFADGLAFVIQNQSANAIGGAGGGLGYAGITSSVAVKFPILGGTSTGIWTNGATGGNTVAMPANIDFRNGHVFRIHVAYDGQTLSVTTTDTLTLANATQTYSIDIPAATRGPEAWFGFTAGTAALTETVDLTSWTYHALPSDLVPPTVLAAQFAHDSHPQSIKLTFSEDIAGSVAPGDLSVRGMASGITFVPVSVNYDSATHIAVFLFASPLPDNRYTATLASGAVNDLSGNLLASKYAFDFFVLAGDANHDGSVGFADLVAVAQNYGQSTGVSWQKGDFNGDGKVDLADLVAVAQSYGKTLPTSAPPAPLLSKPTDALIKPKRPTRIARVATST